MSGLGSRDESPFAANSPFLESVLASTNSQLEMLDVSEAAAADWSARWPEADRGAASDAFEAARAGRPGRFRGTSSAGDGERDWDISIEPLAGTAGATDRLLVLSRDVTELATANRELAQSEDLKKQAHKRGVRFERLAEASGDFIIIADLNRVIEYVNAALLRAMEVDTIEEFLSYGRLAFFPPEEKKFFDETIVPILQREGRYSGMMQFRAFKSHKLFPVAYHAFALRDETGTAVGLASVSRDMSDRKRVDVGMRALAETGAAMYDSLDVESTLRNVADAVVRTFASYCVVSVLQPDDTLRSIGAANRGPAYARHIEHAAQSRAENYDHPAWRAVRRGDSTLIPSMPQKWLEGTGVREILGSVVDDMEMRSLLYVPINAREDGGVYGSLTCVMDARDPRGLFTVEDLRFSEEIAVRAGLALDHARAYERERRIAMTLQEASLPQTLPVVPGLVLSADYRPSSDEATIGGDWYDAFNLDDGRVAITIGDVLGHGLRAAVTMGKVRQAMQAVATVAPDPNAMLDVADRVVRGESDDAYATALAGIFDPKTSTFSFASSGHPGPLVRDPSGAVSDYTATTALLGMRKPGEKAIREIRLAPGSMLVFFTDGLSESGRDVMQGMEHICAAIADPAIARATSPAFALVERVIGDTSAADDIAVLVAAFGMHEGEARPAPAVRDWHAVSEIGVSFEASTLGHGRAKVLIVPSHLEELSRIRSAIRTLIAPAGYAREFAENIELATGELAANAIKYGTADMIEVALWNVAGDVVVSVTNEGHAFDDGGRSLSDMPFAESGRGLAMLRALGCTIDISVTGSRCTVKARIPSDGGGVR